jgi:hypothetical protein
MTCNRKAYYGPARIVHIAANSFRCSVGGLPSYDSRSRKYFKTGRTLGARHAVPRSASQGMP